ncbi:MAG: VacJ family lipoprotein [Sphingomonadales bacterium]|nr:VacJ family lipoprotein [Sphingomonadales bacterium]MBD3773993.1 VacJ family lipoprotein [Paracoccaceae bacterium]
MTVSTIALAALLAGNPAPAHGGMDAVAFAPAHAPAAVLSLPSARNSYSFAQADPAPAQPTPDETPDAAPAASPQVQDQAEAPAQDATGSEEELNVIVVSGESLESDQDPAAKVNLASYQAVQALDDAIVGPVAHGYEKGVPSPIRMGISNVINNLDEPVVFLNFLLQGKPGKAVETLGRFVINSTLGLGGLIDVAKKKPFNLPRRSNGLADTLGYYGVGPGPYLFLPLIGATTVRDLFGRVVDLSLVPFAVGKPLTSPVYSLSKGTLSALTERVANDDQITELRDEGSNGYIAMREFYLQKRQAEIDYLKGKRATPNFTWEDYDPLAAANKAEDEAAAKGTAQPPVEPAPQVEQAPQAEVPAPTGEAAPAAPVDQPQADPVEAAAPQPEGVLSPA